MLLKKNEGKKVGDRDANGDPRARVFESEREEAGVHLTVTVEDKGGGGGGGEGGGRTPPRSQSRLRSRNLNAKVRTPRSGQVFPKHLRMAIKPEIKDDGAVNPSKNQALMCHNTDDYNGRHLAPGIEQNLPRSSAGHKWLMDRRMATVATPPWKGYGTTPEQLD
ncbi:hypothetical protein RB195_000084 [Necator americanus]|uniref:Uncharacterized protein n=1 Tax=Necator americanus TaxID=51031 RepID=A0ABR1DAV7_NECAM